MSQLKPIESKPLHLRPGLHLLTYVDAVDKINAPFVNIAIPMGQIGAQVSFLFSDPTKEGFLTKPTDVAVVRVIGKPAELIVGIFATEECTNPEIKFKTEYLSLETEENVPNVDQKGQEAVASLENNSVALAFSGHVQWQGDVQVAAGEALGNPEKNWRIESLAMHWPEKPEGVDIEYYCHVNSLGESPKSLSGILTGTKARALPISAFSARLVGENAANYELSLHVIFSETGLRPLTANGELFWGLHENEYLTGIRGTVTQKSAKAEPIVREKAPVEDIWAKSLPTEAENIPENIWDDNVAPSVNDKPQTAWGDVVPATPTNPQEAFTIQTI